MKQNILGYRKIWNVIKSQGVAVNRQTVMEIIKEIDPEGVECRRKRRLRRRIYTVPGPDFLWHIDGYDKLKPYGFSIHGCIDGFSRRLIWLEVGTTNKRPEVIANHYIKACKQLECVPTRIRADDGTENSIIEPIQIGLRSAHLDEYSGLDSFIIGTSPANQRIESFWSQLAKDRPMWWRQLFAEMTTMGILDGGNLLVVECVRFCFMNILREELNEIVARWNTHIIAPSKGTHLPRGRPDSLYFLPELYRSTSFKKSVDNSEIAQFEDPSFVITVEDNDKNFIEFAETILRMNMLDVSKPRTVSQALKVYLILIDAVAQYS